MNPVKHEVRDTWDLLTPFIQSWNTTSSLPIERHKGITCHCVNLREQIEDEKLSRFTSCRPCWQILASEWLLGEKIEALHWSGVLDAIWNDHETADYWKSISWKFPHIRSITREANSRFLASCSRTGLRNVPWPAGLGGSAQHAKPRSAGCPSTTYVGLRPEGDGC